MGRPATASVRRAVAAVARVARVTLAALAIPGLAQAQDAGRAPVAELRATVPTADWPAGELGAGVSVRAGWYVRLSAAVLGGALRRADDAWVGTARAEGALRFHLDPFNQAPGCGPRSAGWCRGLYGGLGVSQRWRGAGEGAETPVFLVIVGVEGDSDARRPVVWGLEAAVGGGLRVGASARWRRADGYR
jgi:hypothetical protein